MYATLPWLSLFRHVCFAPCSGDAAPGRQGSGSTTLPQMQPTADFSAGTRLQSALRGYPGHQIFSSLGFTHFLLESVGACSECWQEGAEVKLGAGEWSENLYALYDFPEKTKQPTVLLLTCCFCGTCPPPGLLPCYLRLFWVFRPVVDL